MFAKEIEVYIVEISYVLTYLLTIAYFAGLYFGLGSVFLGACRVLEGWGMLNKVQPKEQKKELQRIEMERSTMSILVFGLSGLFMVFLVKNGFVHFRENNLMNILGSLLILTAWNEVHFYLIHRLLHQKWLFRKVHQVHHQSKIPSVFSVYSFHWLEALLLSTVPFFIITWIDMPIIGIVLFPVVSILFNFSGHCNYRIGTGTGQVWFLFGTRHSNHHYKNKGGYGFITSTLDWLLQTTNKHS